MLIVSWLLGSIFVSILPQLVGYTTYHEIYTTLTQYFATQNGAHLMQFKPELQKLQNGCLDMRDYHEIYYGFTCLNL